MKFTEALQAYREWKNQYPAARQWAGTDLFTQQDLSYMKEELESLRQENRKLQRSAARQS